MKLHILFPTLMEQNSLHIKCIQIMTNDKWLLRYEVKAKDTNARLPHRKITRTKV